jgi:hypothetical protein
LEIVKGFLKERLWKHWLRGKFEYFCSGLPSSESTQL